MTTEAANAAATETAVPSVATTETITTPAPAPVVAPAPAPVAAAPTPAPAPTAPPVPDTRLSDLETQVAKLADNEAALSVFAEMELAKLPVTHQEKIRKSTKEKPADMLRAIALLHSVGLSPAPVAAPSVAPAPISAPAQTAPAVAAPAPTTAPAVDHKEEISRLRKGNPLYAAQYILDNLEAIAGRQ